MQISKKISICQSINPLALRALPPGGENQFFMSFFPPKRDGA